MATSAIDFQKFRDKRESRRLRKQLESIVETCDLLVLATVPPSLVESGLNAVDCMPVLSSPTAVIPARRSHEAIGVRGFTLDDVDVLLSIHIDDRAGNSLVRVVGCHCFSTEEDLAG